MGKALENYRRLLALYVDTRSAEKNLCLEHYDPFDRSQLEGIFEKSLEESWI